MVISASSAYAIDSENFSCSQTEQTQEHNHSDNGCINCDFHSSQGHSHHINLQVTTKYVYSETTLPESFFSYLPLNEYFLIFNESEPPKA